MGTVYVATDTRLHRRVAAKLMREDLIGVPGAADRFEREARALAAFAHPNVVTVHDFGVSGTHAFIVMELLEGVTLREALRREPRLDPGRTLAILRDVTAALDAAHRRQLVHRDLKPENVWLVADGSHGTAKVLDFGLATFLTPTDSDGSAWAGAMVGTPLYMAPEQIRGEAPDASWDTWAVGVMAFEMICGSIRLRCGRSPGPARRMMRRRTSASRDCRAASGPVLRVCWRFPASVVRRQPRRCSASSNRACMADDHVPPHRAGRFVTTRWSLVLAAGRTSNIRSADALASLCETYWHPVYAFIRRQGYDADEGADLTQAFFARVLEKGYFQDADPTRGRFRAFLCTAIRHFLSNERDRERTLKRGGQTPPLSLDVPPLKATISLIRVTI